MKLTTTGEPRDVSLSEEPRAPESIRRLTCVSVTHRTHSTEEVGRIAPNDPVSVAQQISDEARVTEAMVLSTCNRVELYLSTRTPSSADREAALGAVEDCLNLPSDVRIYTGLDVARHLARVATGLESAIIGEDEIIGQVSDTLTAAKEENLASGVLGRVGDAALRIGRSGRTETEIDEGPTDYGGAVCCALEEALGEPPSHVLVVGAGGMARTISETVRTRWDARLDVANRSPAHGLPSDDGRWWKLDRLGDAVAQTDAVVTVTSADDTVFEAKHARRSDGDIAVVDLSTPPDVSPQVRELSGVSVTDLDELALMVRSVSTHSDAVKKAEEVVDESIERLAVSERENRAENVLRALHREAKEVKEEELAKAKRRLEESDADPEDIIEDFGEALAARVLASPTERLRAAAREGDETVIRAASRLFSLEDIDESEEGSRDG